MLHWLRHYRRDMLAGDLGAGVIVALMLVPQSMAYAIVAGLPPVVGLYASLLPAVVYALIGGSAVQSIGPMALTSLMTATALAGMAPAGSPEYVMLAAQLALLSGIVLLACGALRLGFLSSLLSRPVLSGVTSGCALLIIGGQYQMLLGGPLAQPNWPSSVLGLATIGLLLLGRRYLPRLLQHLGCSPSLAATLSKQTPALVLLLATLLVAALDLPAAGVKTIGEVPKNLPQLHLAWSSEHWRELVMPALLIAFMVFLSSQSAAQRLAQLRGVRLDSNRELLSLGAANQASAVSGGFPVTGSLSRASVNFAAGAQSQLAGLISTALLALTLLGPTGWLSFLPLPALAATIVVAVFGMLDLATPREAWNYDRLDALAWLATLAGVLLLGVEEGVVIGVLLSLGSLLARASRPHIAVLGRMADGDSFRNVARYAVETHPDVLLLRVDAGLFFGNAEAVIERVEQLLQPTTRHLLLVMSAVNLVDCTGLAALGDLNRSLQQQGVKLHLSDVKGPVMDRLQRSQLIQQQLSGEVFLSTAQAYRQLSGRAVLNIGS